MPAARRSLRALGAANELFTNLVPVSVMIVNDLLKASVPGEPVIGVFGLRRRCGARREVDHDWRRIRADVTASAEEGLLSLILDRQRDCRSRFGKQIFGAQTDGCSRDGDFSARDFTKPFADEAIDDFLEEFGQDFGFRPRATLPGRTEAFSTACCRLPHQRIRVFPSLRFLRSRPAG